VTPLNVESERPDLMGAPDSGPHLRIQGDCSGASNPGGQYERPHRRDTMPPHLYANYPWTYADNLDYVNFRLPPQGHFVAPRRSADVFNREVGSQPGLPVVSGDLVETYLGHE